MKNTETITPLPQTEHFLIGSKAAVNIKYVQYISYEVTGAFAPIGKIFAVTSNGKIILDDGLGPDETVEKFKSYLKNIELMTNINYIIKEEKK